MEKTSRATGVMNLMAQAGLANLPNLGKQSQVSGGVSFKETFMKTSEVKPGELSFDYAAKKQTVAENPGTGMSDKVKTAGKAEVRQNDTSLNGSKTKELAKEIDEITDQIKTKIREGFEVTDEEIEEAMEVLGLILTDLVNANDLRDLVMQLTGTTDSIELLTNPELYEGLKEVTGFADELLSGIAENIGITEEELTEIINSDEFKNLLAAETDEAEGIILTEENKNQSNPEEFKVENVKAEVTVDEGTRTQNPVQNVSAQDNFKGNERKNESGADAHEEMAAPAQTVQTVQTVNTVGDIVSTVTSYSSYAETENVMRQVTDFVRVNITDEASEIRMQLHPASLGTVNMQINSSNGQITAHLTVQNELVKSILESQMVRLQETFNEQGSKVTAIEISIANYSLDRDTNDNYSQSQEGNRRNGRRGLNLSEIDSIDELTQEEQLQAEVMEMNGSSVNYTA